ncbi:MAG: hypothetical protein ACLFT3_17140, partial [Cyclobacteriaceae bacterium]
NLLGKVGFDMAYYYYADLCRLPLPTYQFKKALYYEALRMPGNISTGVYAMMNGYLKPLPFLQSYLRLLSAKEDVCLDIFYGSDPAFTAACWSEQLKYLLRRPFRAVNPTKKKEKVVQ